MKVLDNFIENLYTGEPVTVGQLKVTPVFIREERALPFLEFEEALARELVEVTEVSEGGSVPNLFVNNKADRDPVRSVTSRTCVRASRAATCSARQTCAAQSSRSSCAATTSTRSTPT